MASRSRENRIIHAVRCPICRAARGEPCHVSDKWREKERGRPLVHTARRLDWQIWKREHPQEAAVANIVFRR